MKDFLFIRALFKQKVDRVPVWCMRQAGRYMKDYQKLRRRYGFLQMVKTPELAAEVTLQPIRRFDFDAAILFSDILVVAEAMGVDYQIREGTGPVLSRVIRTKQDVDRLKVRNSRKKLSYVKDSIQLIKERLEDRALIGFAPAPWTLMAYLIEGKGKSEFMEARRFVYRVPDLFERLTKKVSQQILDYALMQMRAGVDAFQLFDSWAGLLSRDLFEKRVFPSLQQIVGELKREFPHIPLIYFSKGTGDRLDLLYRLKVDCLSLDSTISLRKARKEFREKKALQGNLDPVVLLTNPNVIEREVRNLLRINRPYRGYVFNLGHGVLPTTSEEHMEVMVRAVHRWGQR